MPLWLRRSWPYAVVALAAGAYLYACGTRRFVLDMHYAYYGGYEVLTGRLPYRDFHMAVGPVLFLLQGLFFALFGLSYTGGYLMHAAVLNAAAACMMFDSAEKLTGKRIVGWLAAAITAVWFYPIYHAAPWYDQEAFFFLIAAVWASLRCVGAGKNEAGWLVGAGLAAATSFFTKQSTGGPGMIFLAAAWVWARGWRRALPLLVGMAAGTAVWTGLCVLWGGWEVFWRRFALYPLASGRLGAQALHWQFGCFLLPLILWRAVRAREERGLLVAIALTQLLGRVASQNEIKIFWPFLGLFWAWAWRALQASEERRRTAWLLGAFLLAWGLRLSWSHMRISFFPVSTMLMAALCAGLAVVWRKRRWAAEALVLSALLLGVRAGRVWGRNAGDAGLIARRAERMPVFESAEPQLAGANMPKAMAQDIDALLERLKALPLARRPVFFYEECELFYPILGQNAPQKQLWFDTTAMHPRWRSEAVEARLVFELRDSGVKTVVICQEDENRLLDRLPTLKAWLAKSGELESILGQFRVYKIVR